MKNINLINRVKDIAKKTDSPEVRAICEKFLADTSTDTSGASDSWATVTEKLYGDLVGLSDRQHVSGLLNEMSDLRASISSVESRISKDAAARFSEWQPKRTTNVGNHVDNASRTEQARNNAAEEKLFEGLQSLSNPDANSILADAKAGRIGISESLERVRKSNVITHPNLRYAVIRLQEQLDNGRPETMLVREFLSALEPFRWDSNVEAAYGAVRRVVETRAAEIDVINTAHEIRLNDSRKFFGGLVESMTAWSVNPNRSVPALMRDLRPWKFDSRVRELMNRLELMENNKGGLNVPVTQSNCSVVSVYSPVLFANEGEVFRAGASYYLSSKDGSVSKLSEGQVNGLPKEYLELCEAFGSQFVRVVDGDVIVSVGRNRVRISDKSNVRVNESQVDASNLASALSIFSRGSIFNADGAAIGVAVKLHENIDAIMEIDFAKGLFSNLYEGVGVYMFKRGNNLYINKMNPAMGEDKFRAVGGSQAVKLVREFLSYDISESISDLLEGDQKLRVDLQAKAREIMSNIQLVEAEIVKIDDAIGQDSSLVENDSIKSVRSMLETEIHALRTNWHDVNAKLEAIESVGINEEEEEEEETEETTVTVTPEETENNVEEPAETTEEPAKDLAASSEDLVNSGNIGAAGEQSTEIPGAAVAPGGDAAGVVDQGLAGASGEQDADIVVAETPAETPAVAEEPTASEETATEETEEAAEKEEEAEATEESVQESKTELGTGAKVKVKSSGKQGSISAVNSAEGTYTVVTDDGETCTCTQSEIEQLDDTISDNVEKNDDAAKTESGDEITEQPAEESRTTENEETSSVEVTPSIDPYPFIDATMTIDMGPYKQGDAVKINAAQYASGGDEDPISLLDPKDDVLTVPKKYLQISEVKPDEGETAAQTALENAIKSLGDVETILRNNNKISSNPAVQDAVQKLRSMIGDKNTDE